ncbi:MAG: nitrogenase component 1 [Candidatus Merdivicinus sp.]|jgi:hypothetical protein
MIDLHQISGEDVSIPIKDAAFPVPFPSGLEYAAPARGPWNIVHIGMLIPESHQIFVCAQSCLRGVVLTAAEMGASERFSTIAVQDNNLLDGDMEQLILDGVDEIFSGMEKLPRALLLYTSCIHHFVGCDLDYVFKKLRQKYPQMDFTDCYMNPIMRKSKLPPIAKMYMQLYSLLKPAQTERRVAILGNNEALAPTGEMVTLLKNAGYAVEEIANCKTYDEYQRHAASCLSITTNPAAVVGAKELEKRLGIPHLHLPLCYDFAEMEENLQKLCEALSLSIPDISEQKKAAEQALRRVAQELNGTPISIDYTATPRPLGLAKLLAEHGFRVISVYVDSFSGPEKAAFEWLQENLPELTLHPTVHAKMGVLPRNEAENSGGKLLAIGQKAAYFTGTSYFVNLLEGGGLYGFDGIRLLAEKMEQAAKTEKDVPSIIQVKGWGCCG